MGKLNQIIAIEKGVKSRVYGEISEIHKAVQKPALFSGFSKQYSKKDEDGEDLPPERQRVQFVVSEILNVVARKTSEMVAVTARKDWTNRAAKGSVQVDGEVLIHDAPVPFLLFLEKQLTDMRTLAAALPILDDVEQWSLDSNSGLFKSDPSSTHRTKKVQKPIVLYDATKEHPAQTQLITEDIIVGFWNTVKQSGAMPRPEKQALLGRIEKLLIAVKVAREAANMQEEVETPDVGGAVFGYLLQE